jgi:hypothetical protein
VWSASIRGVYDSIQTSEQGKITKFGFISQLSYGYEFVNCCMHTNLALRIASTASPWSGSVLQDLAILW